MVPTLVGFLASNRPLKWELHTFSDRLLVRKDNSYPMIQSCSVESGLSTELEIRFFERAAAQSDMLLEFMPEVLQPALDRCTCCVA